MLTIIRRLLNLFTIKSFRLVFKIFTVLLLSAVAHKSYAEATFTVTSSASGTGVATGGVDMNGDGVSDGTWRLDSLATNTSGATVAWKIFSPKAPVPNGVGYDLRAKPQHWYLNAKFQVTLNDPSITYQTTFFGSLGDPAYSKENNGSTYTFNWFDSATGATVGSAGALVSDPVQGSDVGSVTAGQVTIPWAPLSIISSGGSITQNRNGSGNCGPGTSNWDNNCVEWYVAAPAGNDTILVNNVGSQAREGFRFGLISYADVAMSKTVDPASMQVGQTGVYTITITNTGTDASHSSVTDIDFTDVLPAGLDYVSSQASYISSGLTSYTDGATGTITESAGTINLNGGKLHIGDSIQVTITFTVSATATVGSTITSSLDTANLSTAQTDLELANNSASVSFDVVDPRPMVSITTGTCLGWDPATGDFPNGNSITRTLGSYANTNIVSAANGASFAQFSPLMPGGRGGAQQNPTQFTLAQPVTEILMGLMGVDAWAHAYTDENGNPLTIRIVDDSGQAIIDGNKLEDVNPFNHSNGNSVDGVFLLSSNTPFTEINVTYIATANSTNDGHIFSFMLPADCDNSDAPTSFSEASHVIVTGLTLGADVDADTDVIVSTDATGDGADDNGITVTTLSEGATADVTIAAANITGTGVGNLHAWIDFDDNGTFDAAEYATVAFNNGASADLTFSGYGTTAAEGTTFARFRLTTDALTSADAATVASDGEVEDYAVTIAADPLAALIPFACTGDLYQSYTTAGQLARVNLAVGDFEHIGSGSGGSIGPAGYRSSNNLLYGLRRAPSGGNFDMLVAIDSQGTVVELGNVSGLPSGSYNAGDFAGDGYLHIRGTGTTGGPVYRIDVATRTMVGSYTLSPAITTNPFADLAYDPVTNRIYGIPTGSSELYSINPVTGATAMVASVTGPAVGDTGFGAKFFDATGDLFGMSNATGKVYKIDTTTGASTHIGTGGTSTTNDGFSCPLAAFSPGNDFSDAPASYSTAQHTVDLDLTLGELIDADAAAQPTGSANGDDIDESNDDDGVVIPTLSAGTTTDVTISASDITGTGTGILHAWIDFDGNGTFDAAEYATVGFNNGASADLTFSNYGTTAAAGTTFARFRLTTDALTSTDAATVANDGEVEDYAVTINAAAIDHCTLGPDTDGDGTFDRCDADDDNDGILDVDEGGVSAQNGFETSFVAAAGTPDLHITGSTQHGLDEAAYEGTHFVGLHPSPGLTSLERLSMAFSSPLSSGATYESSFVQAVGRLNGVNSTYWNNNNRGDNPGYFEMWLGNAVDDQVQRIYVSDVVAGDDGQWHAQSFSFTSTASYTHMTIVPLGTSNLQPYMLIDDFAFYESTDADSDAIPNHLDLDSDNDGISDLVESGQIAATVDTNNDGVHDGAVNVYGVPSAATGGAGVTPAESTDDADTISNYLDLDSDGDGIPDAIEAQLTATYAANFSNDGDVTNDDSDGDGALDIHDGVAGHGGLFTSPQNTDGTGEPDYLDTDSDDDGSLDSAEGGSTVTGLSYADPNGSVNDPMTNLPNETGDTSEVGYREIVPIPTSCTYNGVSELKSLTRGAGQPWPGDPTITYTYSSSGWHTTENAVGGSGMDGAFPSSGVAGYRKNNGARTTSMTLTFSDPVPANEIAFLMVDVDKTPGSSNAGTLAVLAGAATPADFLHGGIAAAFEQTGIYNPSTGKITASYVATSKDLGYVLMGGTGAMVESIRLSTGQLQSGDAVVAAIAFVGSEDFGDAPDSYGTLLATGGASHGLPRLCSPELHLGTFPDKENDGQPDATASLDGADEDGVTVPTLLEGTTTNVTIPAADITGTGTGTLHAWIDFNANGSFDVAEYASVAFNNGASSDLTFANYGTTAAAGTTFARFRLTTDPLTSADVATAASNGEVEDYAVTIITTRPTVSITTGTCLGWDPATGAFPNGNSITRTAGAYWDSTAYAAFAGASFAQFSPLMPAGRLTVQVNPTTFTLAQPITEILMGLLNVDSRAQAYTDENGNPLTIRIVDDNGQAIINGNTLQDVNPGTHSNGNSVDGVFLLSSDTPFTEINITYIATTNGGNDGHVFSFMLPADCDQSDAPTSFSEASHVIVTGLQLGADVDADTGSLVSATADGDGADDDGVTVFPVLTLDSKNYQISVTASNATSSAGRLLAWIDFDGNGRFDVDEAAARVVPAGTTNGSFLVTWSRVPFDIKEGNTFMRLRFTTEALNASSPTGNKSDGEVEDYAITIGDALAAVSGRVYIDTNSNATSDVGEAGIRSTVVVIRNTATGVCRSATTNGNGDYSFIGNAAGNYELYQAHGDTTPVPQSCAATSANNPTGYQSTTPDVLTIDVTTANAPNQNFGEVAGTSSVITTPPTATVVTNTGTGIALNPNHQGVVAPGSATYYAHVLTSEADSAPEANGGVRFTTVGSGSAVNGWSSTLYRDTDCSATLNGTEANTPINGMNFGISAGTRLCIINKVYAPTNVLGQDRYKVDVTATFTFPARATAPVTLPVTLMVTDVTTAERATQSGGESRLVLTKTVENITQGTAPTASSNQAKPGDLLKYHLEYHNAGNGSITELRLDDTVPPFTGFVGGSNLCGVAPTGMNCTANINSNFDELDWTFTGPLVGGAKGSVSYEVVVDN